MVEQVASNGHLRHLISLSDLSRDVIENLLASANQYLSTTPQSAPRNSSLRGYTVANLFFEASTRTRASFELAARRLDANVLNLDVKTSSRTKGESILDTIYTLEAMQVDIFVIRDASTGVPEMIAEAVSEPICVLNAGESNESHPTQGLLDLLTIQQHKGDVANLCVAIVGDIAHSRVARSATHALQAFNVGEVRFVGPEHFLPSADEFPTVSQFTDIEAGIRHADVVMALRIQKERFSSGSQIPDSEAYFSRYGINENRLALADPRVIVMHPGPMNRGTEIESAVADGPHSVIREQVANGLAIRMAVLSAVSTYIKTARGELA